MRRLEECALDAQCSISDLLPGSSAFAASSAAEELEQSHSKQGEVTMVETEGTKLIQHQATVIEQLLAVTRRRDAGWARSRRSSTARVPVDPLLQMLRQ